jgi:hypothetical protein
MIPPTLNYGHIKIEFEINKKHLLSDLKILMGLSNEIESILDPYEAANESIRLSKRYKISKYLAEMTADIQSKTIDDKRFLGIEHKIAIAVEKSPPVNLRCSTPGCRKNAIKNSHALQKNGVLGRLSDTDGRILQTKISHFSKSSSMKEISVRHASVFPGYCSGCEQSEFETVERENSEINIENVTLLLWRSLCLIRYRRAQEVKFRGLMLSKPEMYSILKENGDPFTSLSSAFNLKTSIYSYKTAKGWTEFLEEQVQKSGSDLHFLAIKFDAIPLAGCGLIPIPLDFKREISLNVGNFHATLPTLVYTSVLLNGAPHIILACRKSDKKSREFLYRASRLDSYTLASYIPQIILGGSDTVFFSKDYWMNKASERDRYIFLHSQGMKFPQMVFPFWGAPSGISISKTFNIRK